jgi:hypothetical protein
LGPVVAIVGVRGAGDVEIDAVEIDAVGPGAGEVGGSVGRPDPLLVQAAAPSTIRAIRATGRNRTSAVCHESARLGPRHPQAAPGPRDEARADFVIQV